MPTLYGLDLIALAVISVYTMIKFVRYDACKQPEPIIMDIKRHPCIYGHPCMESREEEVDWYLLTSKKEEETGDEGGEAAAEEEAAPAEDEPAEGEGADAEEDAGED